MRVVSWNVNGIRAATRKGFADWLAADDAEFVGLQEVRALPEQIPDEVRESADHHTYWVPAEKKGYSGVGFLARRPADEVVNTLGVPEFDAEGRFQMLRFGRLRIANVYFPNGSGKDRDNSRIPFKLDFYGRVFDLFASALGDGDPVLVMGDFNTAHEEIDLARPRQNVQTSGFRPEERRELDRWLRAGWVDTYRHFRPDTAQYSWWSQRRGVREKNIGWRIDYVLASPAAMKFVRNAMIYPGVTGSDHCPIAVEVAPEIFGA